MSTQPGITIRYLNLPSHWQAPEHMVPAGVASIANPLIFFISIFGRKLLTRR